MSLLPLDISAFREHPSIRIWRHRRYALYMSGLAPYYVTHWMQRVAVGWLTWELTHSYAWVGILAAAELLPMIILGPLAGALADRHDPLRQARLSQLFLAIEALLLGVATVLGFINIWLLVALSVVSGVIQPVSTASRQLIVPATIPREEFASAISLESMLFHGSRFIGPALAAFMIPVTGVGGPLLVHVVGTLMLFFALLRLELPPTDRSRSRGKGIFADIAEGFRYTSQHAGLWPLFAMLSVCSLLARPLQELLPGFAGGLYQAGPAGLAWLTSAMGIGSMAAGALLATRGHSQGLATMAIVASLGLGLSTFGMVATTQLNIGIAFAVLFGFSLTMMGVGIQTLAQMNVADSMRGRVMIFYVMLYRGLPAVGALAIGALAETIGLRASFAFAAVACVLAWAAIAHRRLEIERALK